MDMYSMNMGFEKPEFYEIEDGRVWSVSRAQFIDKSSDEAYTAFINAGGTTIKAPDENGVNTAEGLRQCLKFYGYDQGELESEEDRKVRRKNEALEESERVLSDRLRDSLLQTETFTTAQFAMFAEAELYPEWTADTAYKKGDRIQYAGIVYEVAQDLTSSSVYPPNAAGVLALYRPLSVEGSEPGDGTLESPYAFLSGMDCEAGKYYSYNGKVYKALQDMKPCVWEPGTAGTDAVWQLVQ